MNPGLASCPACGEQTPEQRFCDQCGEPRLASSAQARDLPTEDETRAGAEDAGRALLLARRYAEAGKFGEFLRRYGGGPPVFLDSYARAFLRLGELRAAMALLGAKNPPGEKDRALRGALAEAVRESESRGPLFKGAHARLARLGAAIRLSESGCSAEALLLVDEELVRFAAAEETECLQVARLFCQESKEAEFLSRWAPGREAAFYSAYARAFLLLERHREALELLERKPALDGGDLAVLVGCRKALGELAGLRVGSVPEPRRVELARALLDAGEDRLALRALLEDRSAGLGRDDFACALRACLRLSDGVTAERLYGALRARFPASQEPDLHYQYALCREKGGAVGPAAEVYRELLSGLGAYKDAADRLGRIEMMSPEETTRLGQAVSAARRPAGQDPALAPGVLVAGRFEVRRPLGIGGMGVVVQGFDRVLPRLVAIKRMRPELARDPEARERFIQEARTVAALSHPYLVAIHDIVAEGREVYLVFEHVEGETLQEVLASRGRLPASWCSRALASVCEALAFAHEKGVIHRDLKPSNIMVTPQGHVKVMDFGIAKQLGGPGPGGPAGPADATRHAAGTPLYMAPEQHEGVANGLSDVYALGATAYELLSGRYPFSGPDFAAQKRREHYAPLEADVPEGLRALVRACLRADPAARPQGMRQVLAWLAGAGPGPQEPDPKPRA